MDILKSRSLTNVRIPRVIFLNVNNDPIIEISVEAPVSNGHGHKIDEVLEVPRPEVQLDSNSAEVSIGNGHDSKVHDVLHAPEGL